MQFLLTRVMITLLAEAKRLTDITKGRTEEKGGRQTMAFTLRDQEKQKS